MYRVIHFKNLQKNTSNHSFVVPENVFFQYIRMEKIPFASRWVTSLRWWHERNSTKFHGKVDFVITDGALYACFLFNTISSRHFLHGSWFALFQIINLP